MKSIINFLFFIVVANLFMGQLNLAPNPRFEDTISCPTGGDSIEFWTNATMQMEIDGATGDVGIGASPLSPFKQNVDNDINLNSSAWGHGYWIDTKLILSTPVIENSLVGENSGNTSGIEFSFLLSQTNYSTI